MRDGIYHTIVQHMYNTCKNIQRPIYFCCRERHQVLDLVVISD